MPPLSETQLAGLKKSSTPITDDDLLRVFTALGLRRSPAQAGGPASTQFQLAIDKTWTAYAAATEASAETARRAWRIEFFVARTADGVRLGGAHRVQDLFVLQRKGAAIMSELFASVDDLTVFACPSCGDGLLRWDGATGARTQKPGMACSSCDWRGNTGRFTPLREHK
jgi:hypothetical protein